MCLCTHCLLNTSQYQPRSYCCAILLEALRNSCKESNRRPLSSALMFGKIAKSNGASPVNMVDGIIYQIQVPPPLAPKKQPYAMTHYPCVICNVLGEHQAVSSKCVHKVSSNHLHFNANTFI
jgi:hypothetical protein